RSVGIAFVDLDVANVAAELKGMVADHLREIICNLVRIVVLSGGAVRQAESGAHLAKADGRKPFVLRIRRYDSQRMRGIATEISKVFDLAQTTHRFVLQEREASVIETHFVDRIGIEDGSVAQLD